MAERADEQLVAAVRSGDADAVLELYRRHAAGVRTAVADRVRGADRIEEVTQEAFTRALERLGELRRPERFRPWLLAIARNTAVDRLRLELRQVDVDPAAFREVQAPGPSPDDNVARGALADLVGRGLDRLSPRDVAALRLASHHDLAPAEVGAALGLSPGAAKVAVHRARRRLRAVLAHDVLVAVDGLACAEHPGPSAAPAVAERHVASCDACLEATRAHLTGLTAA